VAVSIGAPQPGKLFGVSVEQADHTCETVFNTVVGAFQNTHPDTMLTALPAPGIMIGLRCRAADRPGQETASGYL